WISHESNAEGELTLVTAGEFLAHAGLESLEADGADNLGNIVLDILDATNLGVEAEVLGDSHTVHRVELRADTKVRPCLCATSGNGNVFHKDFSTIRSHVTTDHVDCRGFASAIRSEKGENLTASNSESNVFHSNHLA